MKRSKTSYKKVVINYEVFIFPVAIFVVFWPSRLPLIIFIFTLLITIFGILEFNAIANNNFNDLFEIQSKLRPGQTSIPHIAGKASIGGYQASNHDAANILVMLSLFFIIFGIFQTNIKKLFFFALGVYS